jgi:hypothetical protein
LRVRVALQVKVEPTAPLVDPLLQGAVLRIAADQEFRDLAGELADRVESLVGA